MARKRKKCWPGYVAKGTKNSPSGKTVKRGKKRVPRKVNNCVKK